jgi:hypothetical protein
MGGGPSLMYAADAFEEFQEKVGIASAQKVLERVVFP